MSRMPNPVLSVLACALLLQACGESSEEDPREVPLREQPVVDVEMIGEGVISTEAPEFAAAFTPSGDTLFFTRASRNRDDLGIMFSVRDSAGWSEPAVAPFSGGGHRDVDPFVTPDGSRLYFSSDRPAPVGASDMNTWWVDREAEGWSEARTAGPPLNSPASDVFVSTTRDGTLYFSSRRGGRTQAVYRTRPTEEGWERPEPLAFESLESAGNPLVGPDGDFLVLTSIPPGGSPDLYLSCPEGDGWSEPKRLPKGINTGSAEFAPALHPVDSTLVFTSERPGVVAEPPESGRPPGDLYRAAFRPAERCD